MKAACASQSSCSRIAPRGVPAWPMDPSELRSWPWPDRTGRHRQPASLRRRALRRHPVPLVEADRDRGSRGRQAPRSTAARNRSTAASKASGSSRLAVWPVRGRMASPAEGMVRLSISAGSRHPSSSSPTISSTGVGTAAARPQPVQRRPGRLHAAHGERRPRAECRASAAANSAQPRGFLFWNCTRAGPTAYRAATRCAPSVSKAAAVASHSARTPRPAPAGHRTRRRRPPPRRPGRDGAT